ncbi:MAG: 5-methylthioadenosine/S-adenosylhomocysteine deaminase [Gammaproteobacteria bacterium]|jgi:5-methylthioadenosine/S-adenosylhomocysteine deaminase
MNKNTTILLPKWIMTVNPTFELLEDYALVIESDRISDLIPANELNEHEVHHQPNVVKLEGQMIMPGLINSHTHAAMSLFRGLADDLPLMNWLNNHIWPAEAQWINPRFIEDGVELAVAEMIRSGTTCFNDMYFYPDVAARRVQQSGIRAVMGLIVLDFPTVWASNADEYLHKALTVHDELKDLDLVTSAFAPHAPYTVSDAPLKKISMYSNELEIPVHMHIHETSFEVTEAEKKTGMRPLERLDQLNLVNPNLMAVHMTDLIPMEIERLAESGAHVVHCPESNLKLASGICPVAELMAAEINICLGTDGAASNNDLDLFAEMRTAALLAKGSSGDARVCKARDMIEMATINGARALGMSDIIGSIEVGKKADIIAIDFSDLNTQPVYDPVTQVVYALNSRQVSHVWINGKIQLEDHKLVNLDIDDIIDRAKHWSTKIKSGIRV